MVDERRDTVATLGAAKPAQDDAVARIGKAKVRHGLLGGDAARLGRFAVLERLGSGGTSTVYAAYDPRLDRRVALKVIESTSDTKLDSVLDEARAMAKLTHPHVVHVYEAEVVDDEVFIAMEYVQGGSLREWLVREERSGDEILRIFCQAGRGLVAAHDAGLVHGDFKPDNVVVGDDGRARVTDFGLARLAEESSPAAPRGGTPAYMSPEQWHGGDVSPASDQFSFCVALFEALTGQRPFPGDTPEELAESSAKGELPSDTSARLGKRARAALTRGLSAEPSARFESMAALLDALEATPRRWRRGALALAAVALVAIGVATIVFRSETDCETAGAPAHAVIDADTRAAIQSHAGRDAAKHVLAALGSYGKALARRRVATCRATRIDRVQSDTLYDLRMRCLDRRHSAFETLVRAAADPASTPVAIVAAAAELPALDACDDVESLTGVERLPEEPRLRQRIADIEHALDESQARFRLGVFAPEEMRAQADQLVTEAVDTGYQRLAAAARRHRANVLHESDALDEARTELELALRAAFRADDTEAQARVWADLLAHYTRATRQPTVAKALEPAALASLERTPSPSEGRSKLLHSLGQAAKFRGEREHARELLEASIAAWPGDAASPVSFSTLAFLGSLRLELGQPEAGEQQFARAHEVAAQQFGADSTAALWIESERATTLLPIDRPRSRQILERALRRLDERGPGAGDPIFEAAALARLSDVALQLGDASGALRLADASVEAYRASTPTAIMLAEALETRGRALIDLGRLGEARELFTGTLETMKGASYPGSRLLLSSLQGLATASRKLGRYEEAAEHLQQVLLILEVNGQRDSKEYLAALNHVGVTYEEMGSDDQALVIYNRLIAIVEKSGAHGKPLAQPLTNLGMVLRKLRRYPEAKKALARAIMEIEKAHSSSHQDLVYPLWGLTRVEIDAERPNRAIAYAKRAMELQVRHGAQGVAITNAKLLLCEAYLAAGDRRAAARLARELRKDVADFDEVLRQQILSWLQRQRL